MTDPGQIITLTLNPAVDVSTTAPVVAPTHKLRCDSPSAEPGGGGINVSRVCGRLGERSIAVVPIGGFVGAQLEGLLGAEGVSIRAVPIEQETRQSFTVSEASTGDQYRFVLPGPELTPTEVRACLEAVFGAAQSSSCLVVSGSMPEGVDGSFLAEIVRGLPNTKVIVDTSGKAFEWAVSSGAHMLKPSARELAAFVGRELLTEAEVGSAAEEVLAESSVEVLVVSIGAGGAIAVPTSGSPIRLRAPTVNVRSAVGAGDSMVAGLAVGIHRGLSLEQACVLGVAAGTAAVLTDGTRLCDQDAVTALLPLVRID